jgi:HSP20 family molecular chaperone IbpA
MHTHLTRWHPFREMEGFFDQYARAMHRAMLRHEERSATAEIADWAPTVDVSESDDAYVVRAELPGVEKDDVHVSLDNGVLTIQGEKQGRCLLQARSAEAQHRQDRREQGEEDRAQGRVIGAGAGP